MKDILILLAIYTLLVLCNENPDTMHTQHLVDNSEEMNWRY